MTKLFVPFVELLVSLDSLRLAIDNMLNGTASSGPDPGPCLGPDQNLGLGPGPSDGYVPVGRDCRPNNPGSNVLHHDAELPSEHRQCHL